MGGNKLFWTSEGKPINQRLIQRYGALAEKLFPIPRSITGPAIRQSVDLLFKNIEITEHKIASGKKIFDWEAPNEWRLVGAELRDQAGKVLLSSENSSLHVMNFSEPFQGWVARDELLAHLYTLPDQPDKIP